MSRRGLNRPRFRGRPVGKQRTRRFMLTIGFLGTAVLILMGILSFRVADTVPGRSYYDVFAEFTEADNLANHYEVRIGGRRAGQILKPKVNGDEARTKVRLDAEFGPLRTDTTTKVRLRSAVGVRYLEITPGTKGAFIPENGTIPSKQQRPSVPLDAVLGTFDPDTREGVQNTLSQLGGAFTGTGTSLNTALGSATPFLKDLGSLSQAITEKKGATGRLLKGVGSTFGAFDGVRNEIAAGFDNQYRAARAFADTKPDFGATLDEAPPALNTLSGRLPAVNALVSQVDGLARQGKPTLDLAPKALAQTNRLLVESQPSLDEADDTLKLVQKAAPPTVKLLQRLQPELPDVRQLIDSLLPTTRYVKPRQCELVNFTTGWGSELKWGDSRGSQVNFILSNVGPFFNTTEGGILAGIGPGSIPLPGGIGDTITGVGLDTAYPPPCNGDAGNQGSVEGVTVEEAAQGLRYDYTHRPGYGKTGIGR